MPLTCKLCNDCEWDDPERFRSHLIERHGVDPKRAAEMAREAAGLPEPAEPIAPSLFADGDPIELAIANKQPIGNLAVKMRLYEPTRRSGRRTRRAM